MSDDKHSHVFYRYHRRKLPTIAHGQAIYLWDATGKRYIDASGGAVVVNIGHGVKEIADALRDQAARVGYAHATMFTSPAVEQLADRLAERLPMPDARFYLMSSGSEAVETAIKLARQLQMARGELSRYKVIGRWGSYHGTTLGALAVTGKSAMRRFFEPMFVDMPHIPPVYCYRCPFGLTYPTCGLRCADALDDEIKRQGAETVAAFIAEPIAGATLGAVVPPPDYWTRIREICDRHGVLLIADEVMTGMGRAGYWCAIEQWGVTPDIICLGKGLSGGYLPLSAIAARGDLVELLWEEMGDFNHGGTFSHQPVAAAAGLATLDYIQAHDLVSRAQTVGAELGIKLHAALDAHRHVGEVRGQGLMWAVELVADRNSRRPFPAAAHLASRVFECVFADGLIVYSMSGCVDGISGDHVMIAPPLVVEMNQLDEIIIRLQTAIDTAVADIT
ncbi:MAG: aspartate aminotransferase family protein [Chloroflexi bacterium]|nr:aspartate aminotransferase family protein [Chloroflexota bacterium]